MSNINKNCLTDNDCDKKSLCAFNTDDLNNYCISNNINDLYYGCINPDIENNLESIESKSNNPNYNFMDCVNFSRRQINKDNLEYNYMIFKPKKYVFVDTTTINIYLKCGKEILAVIPYNDYFDINCDGNQENCILESKETLLNFIIQNTTNCYQNIHLELNYECENEGLKKTVKIPIDINNFTPIKINLKCPIDNNDKFKSKCTSIYIDEYAINENNYKNLIDMNKNFNDCKNPLFKVPRLVKNPNNYKKIKNKYSKNELNDYDKKINEKVNDLKKLEAEKYQKTMKYQNGINITYEEAYDIMDKKSFDKLIKTPNDKWKIYNNYDAAQNLYHENEKNKVLTYFGKVYTLEDAINVANENDQSFFVWYHNSYELDNFASKLYFIDIFFGEQELLKKTNWVAQENVTTCISKFNIEGFDDAYNLNQITHNDDTNYEEDLINILSNIQNSNNDKSKIVDNIYSLANVSIDKSRITHANIIKHLDDKITTSGQVISMNNYEENINNRILIILLFVIFFVFIVLIIIIVSFNKKNINQ